MAATIERVHWTGRGSGLAVRIHHQTGCSSAFFELVLYRLVSRLGMHLSKIAAQHEWVGTTFQLLTSIGFALLNVVAIFLFLALVVLAVESPARQWDFRACMPLRFPASAALDADGRVPDCAAGHAWVHCIQRHHFRPAHRLMIEYLSSIRSGPSGSWDATYYLRHFRVAVLSDSFHHLWMDGRRWPHRPLVYEANRPGEALMVLASILVFWAYGRGVSFRTRNRAAATARDLVRGRLRVRVSGLVVYGLFPGPLQSDAWPIPSGKPAKGSDGSFRWAWGIPFICPLRFMSRACSAGPIR